jgi:hypothetical protein
MLKFNKNEIELLYEGILELLNNDNSKFSHRQFKDIQVLQEKLLSTGKISDKLNENNIQLLDKVIYNKTKGYVTGQIDGKMIVAAQGSTYLVDPKDLKEFNKKPEPSVVPHMKFNDETQKLLFEQYVKCGVYYGSIPVRLQGCYVRYDQWEKARSDQDVKVLVEGNSTFMPKSQIKILEHVNDFAGEENYVPGVLVDEMTGEATQNILVNVVDYTQAIGDADSIKIIMVGSTGEQEIQTVPRGMVKTLSV